MDRSMKRDLFRNLSRDEGFCAGMSHSAAASYSGIQSTEKMVQHGAPAAQLNVRLGPASSAAWQSRAAVHGIVVIRSSREARSRTDRM